MRQVPDRSFASAILIGAMLSLFCAVAEAEAGRVQLLLGSANLEREGGSQPLRQGTPVEAGDVLQTAASSSVQLSMTNGEQLFLRGDTRMVIDSYVPPASRQDPGRSFYTLVRGGLRAITNTLVRRNLDSYRINTPVATIGIRGTHFALLIQQGLYARVYEGAISIGNEAGTLELAEGQSAYVKDVKTLPGLTTDVPAPLGDEAAPAGAGAGALAGEAARGSFFTPLRVGIGVAGAVGLAAALSGGGDDGPSGTATGASGTTPAE